MFVGTRDLRSRRSTDVRLARHDRAADGDALRSRSNRSAGSRAPRHERARGGRRDSDSDLVTDEPSVSYRARFDECGARRVLRSSGFMRWAQDAAWIHSEALGFTREWYAEPRSVVAGPVRGAERARRRADGRDRVGRRRRSSGYRKVWARRRTEVAGPTALRVASRADRLGDDRRSRHADARAGRIRPLFCGSSATRSRPGACCCRRPRGRRPSSMSSFVLRTRPDGPRQQRCLHRLSRREHRRSGRRRVDDASAASLPPRIHRVGGARAPRSGSRRGLRPMATTYGSSAGAAKTCCARRSTAGRRMTTSARRWRSRRGSRALGKDGGAG